MNQHYHLVGVGGIGMAALASLLLSRGERVSGSDLKAGPLVAALAQRGAVIHIGHAAENMDHPDWVVFSSAVPADNPELRVARERQIPILRRAELLSRLMAGQTGVTVAGAHGKTTTSSMVAHLLLTAGLRPTIAVGGVINALDYNAILGDGETFVAELDESDGSFLLFHPHVSVVTNMDFEHVDYYHNWENIVQAYRQFLGQTSPEGTVIICGDDVPLRDLARAAGRRMVSYGLGDGLDITAYDIVPRSFPCFGSDFSCRAFGQDLGRVSLPVPGRHNVVNALGCLGAGLTLGIDFAVLRSALATFPGVRRRMQFKGQAAGVAVFDDYGHHPTEIRATLETAALMKDRRLVVVFQPHRYSRTKFLMEEFVRSLVACDELLVTDIYAASEAEIAGVSAEVLCEKIARSGHPRVGYLPRAELVEHLREHCQEGDLVLTLGAGDIVRVGEELVAALQQRETPSLSN